MKKKIYKHALQIEILSDEPLSGDFLHDLQSVNYEITSGECSGIVSVVYSNVELEGELAVKECHKHGTDTDFFQMDLEGNEI